MQNIQGVVARCLITHLTEYYVLSEKHDLGF